MGSQQILNQKNKTLLLDTDRETGEYWRLWCGGTGGEAVTKDG